MATTAETQRAHVASEYVMAHSVMTWLRENGQLKLTPSQLDAKAREYAAGPGKAESNVFRAWLDSCFPA